MSNWTATLTGRLGLAFDRWLVYGKGGVAWAGDRYQHQPLHLPGTVEITRHALRLDRGRGRRIRLRAAMVGEARVQLHGLRHRAFSFAPGTSTDIDQQIHAVKFGINYKFGVAAPITARY